MENNEAVRVNLFASLFSTNEFRFKSSTLNTIDYKINWPLESECYREWIDNKAWFYLDIITS